VSAPAPGTRAAPPARGARPLGASNHTSAIPALEVPAALVEAVAVRVADLLAERVPPERDGYLGVEEAAKYLGRPKSRIYEHVAAKRLRHYRDGRSLLFRREDLDAVLRVREVEA